MKYFRSILITIVGFLFFCAGSHSVAVGRIADSDSRTIFKITYPGQIPGEWCTPGIFYMLGEKNPINVHLTSVNYSLGRVKVGNRLIMPAKGQKLVIVHYGLQNPTSRKCTVNQDTIYWSLTNTDGRRLDRSIATGVEATWVVLNQSLDPGQKIYVYAIFPVSAKSQVKTLIASNRLESGTQAAQYDLTNQIPPLKAPYTDPYQNTGYVLRDPVPGVRNTTYMYGLYDINVSGVDFPAGTFAGKVSKSGRQMVLVTVEFTNCGITPLNIVANTTLGNSNAETCNQESGIYAEKTDSLVTTAITPGQKIKVRLLYMVTQGTYLRDQTFKNTQGPDIAIDLNQYLVPGGKSTGKP